MFRHTRAHALLLAVGMAVLAASYADAMSANDYQASKDRIAAEYKAAIAGCASLAGNANDVCEAQAKGQQNIALAQLEYGRSGTEADRPRSQRRGLKRHTRLPQRNATAWPAIRRTCA